MLRIDRTFNEELITRRKGYKEECTKLEYMKILYTDAIIHNSLMTFEGEEFKALLNAKIAAYTLSLNMPGNLYDVTKFIHEDDIKKLDMYISKIQGL